METRVALIGIIVENSESTAQLNALLHDAGQYIIGRMGLPYREKGVSIISVVLDAPQDVISALAGRIGRLPGVSAKTAYSKVISIGLWMLFLLKKILKNKINDHLSDTIQ
jgi:putative iron-only hydrogenase system regulator